MTLIEFNAQIHRCLKEQRQGLRLNDIKGGLNINLEKIKFKFSKQKNTKSKSKNRQKTFKSI